MARKPQELKESNALAKPYEPTEAEAKVLARHVERRNRLSPLPPINVSATQSETGGSSINMRIEHGDKTGAVVTSLLAAAIAVDDPRFLPGMQHALILASQSADGIDNGAFNLGVAVVAGIQPKDHVEALLASQMAAIHTATMNTAARLGSSKTREARIANEKSLNRLARTFTAQVEALKRYRSKGEQRVYVERVNVERGGQAIVGNVAHGGGGDGEESD